MTPRPRSGSPVLVTEEELRGARPARQARSVDAIQRIVLAAQALADTRDFDEVQVADIAAAAGMSVGSFYTRFPSKDHLVVHLMGTLSDELLASMRRALGTGRLRDASLADVVGSYLRLMAKAFVRHRGLLRSVTLIARQTQHAELQELLRTFNQAVHGRFRALLLERLGPDAPPRTPERIDLAILWSSAAMREVLLYGEPVSSLARRRAALVGELTRSVVLYLEDGRRA